MLNTSVLDIAIGLAVVYLCLSVVCTAINELLAQILNLRGKNLERGLNSMLGQEMFLKISGHPLIAPLRRNNQRRPSYLAPRTFALALLDTVNGKHGELHHDTLMTGIAGVSHPPLKHTLTLLHSRANGDPDSILREIEVWYDQSMDRFAGWYKANIQWMTLAVAAVLCVATNADTTAITRTLASDALLRATLVSHASTLASEKPAQPTSAEAQHDKIPDLQTLASSITRLDSLGLGLGWKNFDEFCKAMGFQKLVGLLITIFAVSLGAPFWFDVLSRASNIRSGGKVPAITPTR